MGTCMGRVLEVEDRRSELARSGELDAGRRRRKGMVDEKGREEERERKKGIEKGK